MIPGSNLVVGDAVGILEIAVELAGFDAKHAARRGRVAGQTILPARIEPALRARAGGGFDRNVLGGSRRHQIRVTEVGAPFVGCAIDVAVGVAPEQAGFKPAQDLRVRVVHGQLKSFHENRSGGKLPFAIRRKMNGRTGGQGHPTRFDRAVRPQRRVDGVGDETVSRLHRLQVTERAGLRKQFWEWMTGRRRPATGEGVNAPADAAHLAHVDFTVGVRAERRQSGIIRTGIRTGTLGHDAEEFFCHRRCGFVHGPDNAHDVVAEDVFATQVGGEFRAAINVTADDRAPVAVRIVQDRPTADANARRGHFTERAFTVWPLKIQAGFARLNNIHLLARAFADVANENPSGGRVVGHAMRAAQAEAEKFPQRVRLADKGIVVGNEIIRRVAVDRLARDGMADGAATAIHVQPNHAAEQTFADNLVIVADGIVADGQIKKSIRRVKKHTAAVMPDGLVGQINQNGLGTGIRHAVRVERVAFEPVVVIARRRRPDGRAAGHLARRTPGVIDEEVMVRRKARMKRHAQQAGIVPALALVVDVEHEFFLHHAGLILKRPDTALAFPDAQFIRARHRRKTDGVGEKQIRKRRDRRPVARNARRGFGHRAVEEWPDDRARIEAVGFCQSRRNSEA